MFFSVKVIILFFFDALEILELVLFFIVRIKVSGILSFFPWNSQFSNIGQQSIYQSFVLRIHP